MSADPRRAALDSDMLAWMRSPWFSDEIQDPTHARNDGRFDELARRIFAFQFEHCAPYRRFAESRGATPDSVSDWRQIPAVPAGAFKELELHSFPASERVKTFRTSGTTLDRRGQLHLDTLALYEASLLPAIRRLLLPELRPGERMTIRVLAPSPSEAPDSSLSHMFRTAIEALGSANSGYDLADGALQTETLRAAVSRATRDAEPIALCGTAFAFVHLLDAIDLAAPLPLPPGSLVMETGGFKGRSREMSRDDLYASLSKALGLPPSRIVNQYGMTELGSQFYDSVLAFPGGPRRKLGPPWTRVRLVDPVTGRDVEPGETGMITIHDLANTGSVAAIATADLGRAVGGPAGERDGFEVLGRDPEAEERGCSIAADWMLSQ